MTDLKGNDVFSGLAGGNPNCVSGETLLFPIPFLGTFQGRGSLYIKGHLARRTAKCQKIRRGFMPSSERAMNST
jgi:hypothetical protein